MFGIDDLAIGAATGFAPYLLDEITGAGANRRKAVKEQDLELQRQLSEIEQEAGPNAAGSSLFKMGKAQLDQRDKQLADREIQDKATTGMTDEALLARVGQRTDQYTDAERQLLMQADQRRQQLKALKRRLQLQRLGMNVQMADADSQRLGQLSTGLLSMAPYLFGSNKPEELTTNPGEKKSNTMVPEDNSVWEEK